jgi:hypothetical protein
MPVRLVSQEELPPPLNGYRLIERLGRGGFGEVWKVEAPGGFQKAVKFVFGDLGSTDEDARPAEQEKKALERVRLIRHPYILNLEQVQQIDGQLIVVMELADENLWDRFRHHRANGQPGIPREELLRYMEETAEALDLMNNHYHIQHLDIKPQNLFLVFNHVKVADFGLAKMFEGGRGTITGGVTPVYAAPETFEGYVSRFTDQYSLGIVFQELLTGTRPFNGQNTRQLLMQHLNGSPDLSALPAGDRPVIARALAKNPDDRWALCGDMVKALRNAGQADTPPPAPGRPGTAADSATATRVQFGSPGRFGPDTLAARVRTPRPAPSELAGKPVNSTPLPALVTVGSGGQVAPRLITPTPAGPPNPAATLAKPVVVQTGRMGSLGFAPPEKAGDGALFPALVLAVGQVGREVVEQLRRVVRDRYGSPLKLPHLRYLYLDTDPATAEVATTLPDDPAAFGPREAVHTKLNRFSHYVQREILPPTDQWMPPSLLYKLGRSPGAANGVRAYGRLALVDSARAVIQRLRQEVEPLLTDVPLEEGEKLTGLGLRSNRPRVYVVAGLGGGTGGGMFLDLAYLVRQELRQVGYLRPEVVGVFLVPPAEKGSGKSPALGNAHAALAELYHFQGRFSKYQTVFDRAEPPVADADPPFARVGLLPLPKVVDPKARAKVAGLAARALFDELLTPAGRVIDEVRDVYRNAYPSPRPTAQVFGLYRLSWPRPEIVAAATRRFAQRLVQRWMAKDSVHLREPIALWLHQQWADRKLDFDSLSGAFHAAARAALREDPDRVFDAILTPLRTRTPAGGRVDAAGAGAIFDQLVKLVGLPPAEGESALGSLFAPLAIRYEELAKESDGHLALMAVSFIEQPQYRLAGAEEAVRQIGDRLKRQIDVLEPVRADLDREVNSVFSRLQQLMTAGGGWKGSPTAEVLDLLRAYPRGRFKLHLIEFCLAVYRKLHGNTPEYLREMSYCRSALADMHAALGKVAGPTADPVGPGKLILPDGCPDLDAVADRFLGRLSPEDLLAFDQQLQKRTTRKFRGLASVCLKPIEKGPKFREMFLTKAREFLGTKLDPADPAAVLLRDRAAAGPNLLAEAFDEATPWLPCGGMDQQITILAVPPGHSGERLRAMAEEAVPGVEFTPAPLPDDIVVYREAPQVELATLPQLGEVGRAAFEHLSVDQPPHSRMDVQWQPPGG